MQVSASAWDLAAGRLRGFSGTADNRQLLPLKVHQYQDAKLHHADGRALRSLCDPGMGGPSQVKMLQAKEPQDILKEILDAECKGYSGQGGKVSVLIDCGALLTGMSNREVAEAALLLCDRFLAAIYFDDENQILVLDKDGKETPLSKSPLQPSHPCFTYLDDKHTRGTDLRFSRFAVGAVTVCRKTTKDRLVQASMRMRSLGLGQTVVLFVDGETKRQLVHEVGGNSENSEFSLGSVLAFVTARTAEELKSAVVHWALQGAAFATRVPFLETDDKDRRLARLSREPEDVFLSGYCQSLAPRPGAEEIPRRAHETPRRILKFSDLDREETQKWHALADSMIMDQLAHLRDQEILCSEDVVVSSMDEEQEREREQEKEREKEVEIEMEIELESPALETHIACVEDAWIWSNALQQGFVTNCKAGSFGFPKLHGITADEFEESLALPQLRDLREIPSHIFVTSNWLCSVKITDENCSEMEKAHSLRTVDAYLMIREAKAGEELSSSTESFIMLSGWEASQVLREIRECKHRDHLLPTLSLKEWSVQLGHLSDSGTAMSISPWGNPTYPHDKDRVLLKLLNGSCCYWPNERTELAKFLGILEPNMPHWNGQGRLMIWDILRDLKVLQRNGFITHVPQLQDFLNEVAAEWENLDISREFRGFGCRAVALHKCLSRLALQRKNPASVVAELVKFRLQGHLFRASSLEELLGL